MMDFEACGEEAGVVVVAGEVEAVEVDQVEGPAVGHLAEHTFQEDQQVI